MNLKFLLLYLVSLTKLSRASHSYADRLVSYTKAVDDRNESNVKTDTQSRSVIGNGEYFISCIYAKFR